MPFNIATVVSAIRVSAFKPTLKIVHSAVSHFGSLAMADADAGVFDVDTKPVQDFMENYGGERITGINRTSQKRIRKILTQAVKDGKTTTQIATIIADKFDQWSAGRAYVIADTEVTRASSFGSWQGMKQAKVEQKEWLAVSDKHTRDTHASLNGTIVDVDDPFISKSGALAMFPGDFGVAEEDVNCRCTVLSVYNGKVMRITHRSVESERKPFDTKYRKAMQGVFAKQKASALSALGT